MKYSKVLLSFFAIVGARSAVQLLSFWNQPNYHLFADAGLEPLFFISTGLAAALCAGALFLLSKEKASAEPVAIYATAASLISNVLIGTIGISNIEALKNIFASMTSRSGRSLPPEALEFITSPVAMASFGGIILLIHFGIFVAIRKNREYFETLGGRLNRETARIR